MIINMKRTFIHKTYFTVSILGKAYKLNIKYEKRENVKVERLENEINIILPNIYKNSNNEEIINMCIQKIYNEVAGREVENAMEFARHVFGFAPEDYKIKRINEGYYKYSNKILTINPDIAAFSREVIYTSLIKVFCKVKYREGSKNYEKAIEKGIREYEIYKNEKTDTNLCRKVG